MGKPRTILAQARGWATQRKLFGPQAFLRYVILSFLENLNQTSKDFVFKGGNLLWVYIATPRSTIDLDLATRTETSHSRVRAALEKACDRATGITYSIRAFKPIVQEGKAAAAVTIGYTTDQGASNQFEIDIVYSLDSDSHEIESPIHTEIMIRSATIENIICDKLAACHRFGAGNTRMKDYDDLWRLSQSDAPLNSKQFSVLLKKRQLNAMLDRKWINPDLERAWDEHRKRYPDLPKDLSKLFSETNSWLAGLVT